jgi:hypothetical protein
MEWNWENDMSVPLGEIRRPDVVDTYKNVREMIQLGECLLKGRMVSNVHTAANSVARFNQLMNAPRNTMTKLGGSEPIQPIQYQVVARAKVCPVCWKIASQRICSKKDPQTQEPPAGQSTIHEWKEPIWA